MKFGLLDRYLLWEWTKIFVATAAGFPLFVIIIDVTEKMNGYLLQGIAPAELALSYVFSFPANLSLVLPAAVLFATVFTISAFSRHSELSAAKASGQSFYRLVVPILMASLIATGLALGVGEIAPAATRKQMELLGKREQQSGSRRFNFVYRAEEGWVYVISSIDESERLVRDIQMEREGTGEEYPTLIVQSRRGTYSDSLARWTLRGGRFRILTGGHTALTFEFDSMRVRDFSEEPATLLAEPARPEEMDYVELGRYIDALERSGGDGRKLRVGQELKIALPFTCLIIALFSAPLAVTAPRVSGAFGIGLGLGTTIVFLLLVQLSQGIGTGGLLPPVWAAWMPNILFSFAGLWLMIKVRT
ncbi:MAG: LptF/LptG family permease [Gemmatimonadetes bacterium]|nr:LptF/LptG family permease [Gemmatimonadota bacterium]